MIEFKILGIFREASFDGFLFIFVKLFICFEFRDFFFYVIRELLVFCSRN